jgi:putative ABC transport system ATP-binding protein
MRRTVTAELLMLRKRPATWILFGIWTSLGVFFAYVIPYALDPEDSPGGIGRFLPEAFVGNVLAGFPFFGGVFALMLGVFAAALGVLLGVLSRGTSLAIVGPSGSGKSTLLNILGCLDRQSSGTYLLEGIDVGRLSDGERAAVRAQRLGFVFQSFNLLAHRTVLDNVMLAEVYRGAPREGRAERALAALERVGMTHRSRFRPTRLSGGEQQRVAIARALMGEHSVLLCDEPTGNLDSVNTRSILSLFDELGEAGLTLVIVTHADQVAEHARRRVRMSDGRLTEEA